MVNEALKDRTSRRIAVPTVLWTGKDQTMLPSFPGTPHGNIEIADVFRG